VTRVLLIRHCEPEPDAAGRCYGSLDFGLSEDGRAAAHELADAVHVDAVVSSPRRRALETAAPLAERNGLQVEVDDRLRELDFGELEGLTYEEVERTRPDVYRAWMEAPTEVTFPGGESYAVLRARSLAALDEVRARHAEGVCAIVAHGGPIRAILAGCLQMPDSAVFRLAQSYGAVSVVDWAEGVPIVRLVNVPPAAVILALCSPPS
jgi:alpha-ribazole phosphatase/probable phosphoglycerate mutase